MLSVSSYKPDYIEACRARVRSQIATYNHLLATVRSHANGGAAPLASAIESFDAVFYKMVLTLDSYFTHRARTMEGKDGNPLNEVRVLCNSLLGGGALVIDKTIKLDPAKSVLGYATGDEIKVGEEASRAWPRHSSPPSSEPTPSARYAGSGHRHPHRPSERSRESHDSGVSASPGVGLRTRESNSPALDSPATAIRECSVPNALPSSPTNGGPARNAT